MQESGLIYSRLNNPNLQIFEERMAAWDRTEAGAMFASGMAAISTSMLALVRPGDVVISTAPVYGGTHYLFEHILPRFSIEVRFVAAGDAAPAAMAEVAREVGPDRVRALFLETPANPNNANTDIAAVAALGRELASHGGEVHTIVDNTLLGPVFQRPGPLGADLVLYSATKFIGGHSDLVAGVATGSRAIIDRILELRTILGTMTTPFQWMALVALAGDRLRSHASAGEERTSARACASSSPACDARLLRRPPRAR